MAVKFFMIFKDVRDTWEDSNHILIYTTESYYIFVSKESIRHLYFSHTCTRNLFHVKLVESIHPFGNNNYSGFVSLVL